MPGVVSPPRPRRNAELFLLVLALGIGLGANLLGALGTEQEITTVYWVQAGVLAAASLALHVVLRLRAPFADPYILPITVALNSLGLAIIHRLETSNTLADATTQLVWTVLAMVAAGTLLWLVRDHRLLRRWPYLFLAASALLLVLPLIPGLGMTVNCLLYTSDAADE